MLIRQGQKPLFIFEMANNHQGSFKHALKIVKEFYGVSKKFKDFDFGFKFQYRDIDTFIHPDYKKRYDLKYVKRFSKAQLAKNEFQKLKNETKKLGFVTICTPFDENSVDLIEKHNFDIIKIGSCSFTDWPLLERIVKTDKPIIASVGGTSLENIDKVVSFLTHRKKNFILMHCVGQYPTLRGNLQLNQIDLLKQRYQGINIGYSTHEEPNNFQSIQIAIAKGVTIFEKHVGIRAEGIELNNYSITPEQANQWLSSAKEAFDICGTINERMEFSEKELADIRQFQRGVFIKKRMNKNQKLNLSDVFFAWPNIAKQLVANDMSKYMDYQLKREINKNEPILSSDVKKINVREKVYKIIVETRKLLEKAKIILPDQLDIEISHHYGVDNFYKHGAVIINCVNRDYCKKLIVLFPKQSHPSHFHKKKEETFQVLYGDMRIALAGQKRDCKPGDIVLVERGVKHNFSTEKGVIFEEISTTHFKNDSFYDDEKIKKNEYRKTSLTYWLNID